MKNAKAWVLIQIASVFNVLVGVVAAHSLTNDQFGKFATVLASIAIIVSVLNPLINEISRVVSVYGFLSSKLINKLTSTCCIIAVGISAVCCLPMVENLAQSVILLILIPTFLVISSWFSGVLIGLNQFVEAGLLQIAGAFSRLGALLIGLIFLPNFITASFAYVIGFFVTICYGIKLTWNNLKIDNELININYVVVVGFFLLALPFSLDQVLVQWLYPQISGEYAAIMTYSKIIMLASAPALTIAYGSAVQVDPKNFSFINFTKSTIKIAAVTFLLVGVFWLLAPWCFTLLLGTQYKSLIPNLYLGLVSIGLHVVSYMIFQTLVLHAKWWLIPVLGIIPAAQVLGILFFAQSDIDNLLYVSFFVFAAQLVLALIASFLIANRRLA